MKSIKPFGFRNLLTKRKKLEDEVAITREDDLVMYNENAVKFDINGNSKEEEEKLLDNIRKGGITEIYHGSNKRNIIPNFNKTWENTKEEWYKEKSLDFGPGFYCGVSIPHTVNWAINNDNRKGYLNKYFLDTKELIIFEYKEGMERESI